MIPDTPDWTRELCSLLEEEIRVATLLWGAIKREREALRARDADALTSASGVKQQCLAELDALDKDRRQMLEMAGLPSDRAALDKYLETVPDNHPVAYRWQRLIGLFEQCRQANIANGQMVAIQRSHVERALRVLRTGNPDTLTYGPDGSHASGAGSRTLSSA
ncbi:MAG: flagellar protein FlgN [Gammaproteobacteria bacterium]|nr:flagellar protein FlgN [Gammaproteobacteria bacterium]